MDILEYGGWGGHVDYNGSEVFLNIYQGYCGVLEYGGRGTLHQYVLGTECRVKCGGDTGSGYVLVLIGLRERVMEVEMAYWVVLRQ